MKTVALFFVLSMLAYFISAYNLEDYPYNSSRINRFSQFLNNIFLQILIPFARPSYQRKLRARGAGPTMPATGWQMCCEAEVEVVPNMEHSYVWPMETPERNYFVVSGMKILYSTAHDSIQFKIVEPNLEDNKISITGTFFYIFDLFLSDTLVDLHPSLSLLRQAINCLTTCGSRSPRTSSSPGRRGRSAASSPTSRA